MKSRREHLMTSLSPFARISATRTTGSVVRHLCKLLFMAVVAATLCATAAAAPLTFTFDGIASGSLNGVSFQNAEFNFRADTEFFQTASFSIGGLGSGFIGPGHLFLNDGGAVACPTYPLVSSALGLTIPGLG